MVLGRGLGTASGSITIDTRDLERAGGTVLAVASSMTDAFNTTSSSLADYQRTASLAFGGLITSGVIAAQKVKTLKAVFTELVGSQTKANEYMVELRDLADQTGQSFLDILDGSRLLIPAVKQYNADLRQTVTLAEQLSAMHPEQGFQGAAFALGEFYAGNITSIRRRFNLDKDTLKQILADSKGDMAAAGTGLQEYIDKIGISQEGLKRLGDQGVFAFTRMKGAITEMLDFAFRPLLNDTILPLFDALQKIFKQAQAMDPALTSIAAKSITMLGAGAILGKLGFGTLGSAVVSVGATNIATDIGIAVARALAQRGAPGSQLANSTQEQARVLLNNRMNEIFQQGFTALGQLVGMFQVGFTEIKSVFSGLGQFIAAVFDNVGKKLTLAGLLIQNFVDQAVVSAKEAITGILAQIGITLVNAFPKDGIFGGLHDLGGGILANLFLQSLGDPDQKNFLIQQQQQLTKSAADLNTQFPKLSDFMKTLDPQSLAAMILQTVNSFGTIGKFVANTLFPLLSTNFTTAGQEGGAAVTAAGQDLADSLLGVVQSADFLQIKKKMEDQAGATSRETDDRLLQVTRQEQDFAIQRIRELFQHQLDNSRGITDEFNKEQDQIAKISKLEQDAKDDIEKKTTDYNTKSEDDLKEHQDRLTKIYKDSFDDLMDAIAAGNGAAAIKAIRNAKKQSDEENTQYGKRKAQLDKSFQDDLDALKKTDDAKVQDAKDQLAKMRSDFVVTQRQRDEDFNRQLQFEDQDRQLQLTREQEDFQRHRELQKQANDAEIADMVEKLFSEEYYSQQFTSDLAGLLERIRSGALTTFQQIADGVLALGPPVTNPLTPGLKTRDPKYDNADAGLPDDVRKTLDDFYRKYTQGQRLTSNARGKIPSHSIGSSFIPYDQLAYLHRGEAVISARSNKMGMAGYPWSSGGGAVVINASFAPIISVITRTDADAEEIATLAAGKALDAMNEGIVALRKEAKRL